MELRKALLGLVLVIINVIVANAQTPTNLQGKWVVSGTSITAKTIWTISELTFDKSNLVDVGYIVDTDEYPYEYDALYGIWFELLEDDYIVLHLPGLNPEINKYNGGVLYHYSFDEDGELNLFAAHDQSEFTFTKSKE